MKLIPLPFEIADDEEKDSKQADGVDGVEFALPAKPAHFSDRRRRSEAHFQMVKNLNSVYDHVTKTGEDDYDQEHFNSAGETLEDPDISMLLENNRIWVRGILAEDPEYFSRLGQGQAPKFLYIGCSDSRVPANQILGLQPGEVFVHRNVGNIMPASDLNSLTVLEYAVEHLDVRHIIVTGHYECGAIAASLKSQDHGLVENWIRNIRDVYRLHHKKLDTISDLHDRQRRLVELNVIEQCLNLYKTSVVQRKRLEVFEKGISPIVYPRIHGLVFDPKVGILRKLPIDFHGHMNTYKHIYNLYAVPTHPVAETAAATTSETPSTETNATFAFPQCSCSHPSTSASSTSGVSPSPPLRPTTPTTSPMPPPTATIPAIIVNDDTPEPTTSDNLLQFLQKDDFVSELLQDAIQQGRSRVCDEGYVYVPTNRTNSDANLEFVSAVAVPAVSVTAVETAFETVNNAADLMGGDGDDDDDDDIHGVVVGDVAGDTANSEPNVDHVINVHGADAHVDVSAVQVVQVAEPTHRT
eukprot:c7639_g2_i1.p1 GENE.c7639_g2_i1~~c7639_g2_i1.p1  ORF type:complete len:560 (-),score=149.63 c7639_g2_i1:249-1823(-)